MTFEENIRAQWQATYERTQIIVGYFLVCAVFIVCLPFMLLADWYEQ